MARYGNLIFVSGCSRSDIQFLSVFFSKVAGILKGGRKVSRMVLQILFSLVSFTF